MAARMALFALGAAGSGPQGAAMSTGTALASHPGLAAIRQQLVARWRAFAPRERRALAIAGLLVALFAVWSVLVQPAWRTLREAPAQLDSLDGELQHMQRLAAEAAELRGTTPVSTNTATLALQSATARLGNSAKIVIQGDRATLTVSGTSPEALTAWLAEARSAARARPLEAQLARTGSAFSGTVAVTFGGAP
jgi:general secretion pathway protein M